MSYYEKVKTLCEKAGFPISRLHEVTGIPKTTKGTVSKWQDGAKANPATVKAVADYFSVSVEYLMDDSVPVQTIQTVQDNHGIIGTTNAPVTIVNGSERKLSEQEVELLSIFGKLSVMDQAKLLVYAEELKK